MGYTYDWKLTGLRKQHTDDLSNVVVGTFWKVTMTDEDGNTGEFSGATPFDLRRVNTGAFIDYHSLDEQTVLEWVKPVVSGSAPTSYWDHIHGKMLEDLNAKKYTRIMVMEEDLPWSANSGSGMYGIDPQPV